MPEAAIIIRNAGIDPFGNAGGQLIEDTGIISDLDGGFDTATVVVLYPGSSPKIEPGSAHPDFENLYLFGVSPARLPGGYSRVTLTYKGLSMRAIGGAAVPTADAKVGKFTYGMAMTEKTWAPGELEGTINNRTAANYTVGVTDYRRTIRVAWVGNMPVQIPSYNAGTGQCLSGFGSLPILANSPYDWIKKPMINYPWGWVPVDVSAEQAYPGVPIWLNSITVRETPEFTPA